MGTEFVVFVKGSNVGLVIIPVFLSNLKSSAKLSSPPQLIKKSKLGEKAISPSFPSETLSVRSDPTSDITGSLIPFTVISYAKKRLLFSSWHITQIEPHIPLAATNLFDKLSCNKILV